MLGGKPPAALIVKRLTDGSQTGLKGKGGSKMGMRNRKNQKTRVGFKSGQKISEEHGN